MRSGLWRNMSLMSMGVRILMMPWLLIWRRGAAPTRWRRSIAAGIHQSVVESRALPADRTRLEAFTSSGPCWRKQFPMKWRQRECVCKEKERLELVRHSESTDVFLPARRS
ncbi:hypothetical protein BGW36DRAFT_194291 [Talaromyces proteolyticus]|uniref:Uncharacterized protein n=1 Tax=Talaromyces proteolyticus TaxID=1131652 RepID=A0AAD4KRK8_9EURO|nr:uncharacterized protein BGW36DRAFT_194291 [Talaromyces proteolyticus]KAH8694967.1 hypothetical protein BGW36DRAFT_194291 [Talaromyces proteolyticus]